MFRLSFHSSFLSSLVSLTVYYDFCAAFLRCFLCFFPQIHKNLFCLSFFVLSRWTQTMMHRHTFCPIFVIRKSVDMLVHKHILLVTIRSSNALYVIRFYSGAASPYARSFYRISRYNITYNTLYYIHFRYDFRQCHLVYATSFSHGRRLCAI